MNITVYLGAHEGNDPSYRKAVEELGAWIAGNGNRLSVWMRRARFAIMRHTWGCEGMANVSRGESWD